MFNEGSQLLKETFVIRGIRNRCRSQCFSRDQSALGVPASSRAPALCHVLSLLTSCLMDLKFQHRTPDRFRDNWRTSPTAAGPASLITAGRDGLLGIKPQASYSLSKIATEPPAPASHESSLLSPLPSLPFLLQFGFELTI